MRIRSRSTAKRGRGKARRLSSRKTAAAAPRPYLLVRVNSLQTGLTDADLDAVAPEKPDAIMLPKAEGGASIVHADAKLAVREAMSGLPDGHIKIMAIATETAAALFRAGTYAGSSARLTALTWGAEDLSAELGAETNRDEQGRFLDPYRLARALCLSGAAAAEVAGDRHRFCGFPRQRRPSPRMRGGAPRRIFRQDGHPSGAGADHQRAVHPTPEVLAQAQAVVDAFAANPDAGVVGIAGAMVDRPHLTRAKRLLARAATTKS